MPLDKFYDIDNVTMTKTTFNIKTAKVRTLNGCSWHSAVAHQHRLQPPATPPPHNPMVFVARRS